MARAMTVALEALAEVQKWKLLNVIVVSAKAAAATAAVTDAEEEV